MNVVRVVQILVIILAAVLLFILAALGSTVGLIVAFIGYFGGAIVAGVWIGLRMVKRVNAARQAMEDESKN